MAVKVWKKPFTQGIIKQLRASGYTVVKHSHGSYQIFDGDKIWMLDGRTLFRATPYRNRYLVSYHDDLLTAA
tara:strand:- start:92 stop:307 length:216 start_codon:yes stop_codon:yes gene_type:complete